MFSPPYHHEWTLFVTYLQAVLAALIAVGSAVFILAKRLVRDVGSAILIRWGAIVIITLSVGIVIGLALEPSLEMLFPVLAH